MGSKMMIIMANLEKLGLKNSNIAINDVNICYYGYLHVCIL